MTTSELPLVSILIMTKNSATTLRRCLKSVMDQTYPNIEVIVVDNFSTDDTEAIAGSFGCRFFQIGPERSSQKNMGAKKAKGKYIYIVDSDFFLEADVVRQAVVEAECRHRDAVLVHNTSDPSVSFWARVRKLERDCYEDDYLNVAVFFMRRDVFLALGGYDEKLVACEDYDLHNRLLSRGYSVGRIRAREVHFGEPTSLSEIVRKHIYYGKTINVFLSKAGTRGIKQISFIRPAYLRRCRSFFRDPILTSGFLFYQFVRYCSALVGYVSQLVDSL